MWVEEYNRLMFKPINNHEETIQAVKIKHQNMPNVVISTEPSAKIILMRLKKGFLWR